jgi:LuxR family transcriptional regulator, regulator of acetate metabolism
VVAPPGTKTDEQLLAHAVGELARRTRFPVAFGGFEHDGAVRVSAVVGTRTRNLDGLVVEAARGLGGQALVEKRPRLAVDYGSSRNITHDYDRAVLGEGISTLFAIPVMVRGDARGILYCGSWSRSPIGDLVTRPAFTVAGELGTELHVREEVERRLAATPARTTTSAFGPAAQEQLRESYAELRSIAATVDDPAVRDRLAKVEGRLAALAHEGGDAAETDVHLSPREIDVLACAALGATNAQIAATLSLKEVTVKSYLQAAMAKLDAATRHAAVAKARKAGLLP